MRGFTFVLVPTLSLVNMGVNAAAITALALRGDGSLKPLGMNTQTARQFHTADFTSGTTPGEESFPVSTTPKDGTLAQRGFFDGLIPSGLPKSSPLSATKESSVGNLLPRMDIAQNEMAALTEDISKVKSTAVRRQLSVTPSIPSPSNLLGLQDNLIHLSDVSLLSRAESEKEVDDLGNSAVCPKDTHESRALEITNPSTSDPITIKNLAGSLATSRGMHGARQVDPAALAASLPVVGGLPRDLGFRALELESIVGDKTILDGIIANTARGLTTIHVARQLPDPTALAASLPVVGGVLPRDLDSGALELTSILGDDTILDDMISNTARGLSVTPTLNKLPLLAEADVARREDASATAKLPRDFSLTINALQPSLTSIFARADVDDEEEAIAAVEKELEGVSADESSLSGQALERRDSGINLTPSTLLDNRMMRRKVQRQEDVSIPEEDLPVVVEESLEDLD